MIVKTGEGSYVNIKDAKAFSLVLVDRTDPAIIFWVDSCRQIYFTVETYFGVKEQYKKIVEKFERAMIESHTYFDLISELFAIRE